MNSSAPSPQAPQPVDIIAALATEVNAEVNAEVMEAKSRGLSAAIDIGEAGPSNAPSRSHSRAVDNEGDVEMGETATEPIASTTVTQAAPVPTAPLSPAASIPTSVPAIAEPVIASVEPAESKVEEETVQQPLS